jgi:hypothetical protein
MARAQATPIPMRCIPNGILIVGLLCGSQFVNRILVSDEHATNIGVRSDVPKYRKQKDKCTKIGIKSKVETEKILCQITIVRQERMLMAELSPRMKMVMGRTLRMRMLCVIQEMVPPRKYYA